MPFLAFYRFWIRQKMNYHTTKKGLYFAMRNYQSTKNNPYYLPDNVFKWYLYIVQDIGAICKGSTDPITYPEDKYYFAVSRAIESTPGPYRKIIFDNLAYGTPIPKGHRGKMATTLKARFVYSMALFCSPQMPDIIQ